MVDKVSYFDVLVQHSWHKLRKTTANNSLGCWAGKNTCANDVPRAFEPRMQKSCKSAGKHTWFRVAPQPVMWHQRWQGVSQEILCVDATRPQGVGPPARLGSRSAVDATARKVRGSRGVWRQMENKSPLAWAALYLSLSNTHATRKSPANVSHSASRHRCIIAVT